MAIFLLLFACTTVFAGTEAFIGLEAGSSWYLGFPKYQDSLPYRSSVTGDAAFDAGIRFDSFSLSIIVPFSYVSASPTYDGTSRRQFISVGGGLRFGYDFTKAFSLFASASMEYNRYFIDQVFLSFTVKAGPKVTFAQTDHWRFSVEMPIGVQMRKDINGMTVGLSMRVDYGNNNEVQQ